MEQKIGIQSSNIGKREPHKTDINKILNVQQNDFLIELGSTQEMRDGTTSQFIQVYYKNELIIDTDGGGEGSLNVIINYKNIPIKIKSIYENKDDIRYIHHNQAYVGSIALPKKYVGLGFLKFIYQQISNTLGVELVRGDTISIATQRARDKRKDKPFVPIKEITSDVSSIHHISQKPLSVAEHQKMSSSIKQP